MSKRARLLIGLITTSIAVSAAATGLEGELRVRGDHYLERKSATGGGVEVELKGRHRLLDGALLATLELSQSWMDGRVHERALLREASWEMRSGRWRAAFGRLMAVRGRADGFRVLDVLVPVESPAQFHDDTEHSRVGAWGAEIDHFADDSEFGMWLSADRQLDRVTPPGDDIPRAPADASDEVDPLSVGVSWRGRVSEFEFSTLAYHGLWRQPLPGVDRGGRDAARVNLLGASFDVPVGALVIRGEAASMAYDVAASVLGLPDARALVGVDWLHGAVLISPQLFAERSKTLTRPEASRWHYSASLLVDARFMQDRLHLRYFGVFQDRGRGRWQSVHAAWQTPENHQWRFRLDTFDGDRLSELGVFSARSRVSLEWVVPFGTSLFR